MANTEMKKIWKDLGLTDEGVKKMEERYDLDLMKEIVGAAKTPKEAFENLHAVYPELEVSEMEKKCDFYKDQIDQCLKEKAVEKSELSDSELESVAGGGFFSSIGDWFCDNWKAVAISAAIVVGTVATAGALGAGIGAVAGVFSWGYACFGTSCCIGTILAGGFMTLTGVTTATIVGTAVGAAAGAAAGAAVVATQVEKYS